MMKNTRMEIVNMVIATITVKTTVRGKILAILASRDPSRIHHLSKCFITFLADIIKNDDP